MSNELPASARRVREAAHALGLDIAVREMPVGSIGDNADHARHFAQHDRVRTSRARKLDASLDERSTHGATGAWSAPRRAIACCCHYPTL